MVHAVRLWFCALLLGPSVGSFCGLLLARLPRRASPLAPGSHCLACSHPLALADLIPILSFVWLRGRCRHCDALIPRLHLAAELGCTLIAAAGAALAGWTGLVLALVLCMVAGAAWGLFHPSSAPPQRGSVLLEVALAAGLLAIVLVPVLGLISMAGRSTAVAGRHAQATALAVAKLEQCRSFGYSTLLGQASAGGTCNGDENNLPGGFHRRSSVQSKDPSDTGAAVLLLRVSVEATGTAHQQVRTLQTLVGQGE